MLRLAAEFLAQFRVLCGYAYRACVQVAFAHHDAPADNQGRCGESKFVRAKQRANRHIAACLKLSVHLHPDAVAQVVAHQCLMGFGQTQFPRQPGMFDGTQGGRTGAAVMAADQYQVGLAFRHASGDGAHTGFRNQFHGNRCLGVAVLQVVDQLREVFNGINVMMRRRRDEFNAGRGIAHLGDFLKHLVTRQLAAFARLRALCHFYLDFIGIHQVLIGHTEAPGCHLLDGATAQVAVFIGFKATRVFAAFTGIAASADAVHGNGEVFMGFAADTAEGHGACTKAFHNFCCRFHFFQGNWSARLEFQQPAQGCQGAVAVVHLLRKFLIGFRAILACCMLEVGNGFRVPLMELATATPPVDAAGINPGHMRRLCRVGHCMTHQRFPRYLRNTDAADARRCSGETLVHHGFAQANGFKYLGATVTVLCGNANLGHGFQHALFNGLSEVLLGVAGAFLHHNFPAHQVVYDFVGHVGVHTACAVAGEQTEVHYFPRFAGFNDQPAQGALVGAHQMLMYRANSKQTGQGRHGFACAAV